MKINLIWIGLMAVLVMPVASADPSFNESFSILDAQDNNNEFKINEDEFDSTNLTTFLANYNSSEDNVSFTFEGEGHNATIMSISGNILSFSRNPPQASDVGSYLANITLINDTNDVVLDFTTYAFSIVADSPSLVVEDGSRILDSDSDLVFTARRGNDYTKVIELSNEGSYDMRIDPNLVISEDHTISLNESSSFDIPAKSSRDVEVSISVPDDQSSGSDDFGEVRFAWSSTVLGEDVEGSTNFNVRVSTRNDIVFDEIEVYVDGSRAFTEGPFSDGDFIRFIPDRSRDEIKPDSQVRLEVTLENTNRDYDYDVEIELFSTLDAADGLRQTSSISRDRDRTFTFRFDLDPTDIDDDFVEIDFEIFAETDTRRGRDDVPDIRETSIYTLDLEIEREDRDVRFLDASIRNDILSCSNPTLDLDIRMVNTGRDDLSTATVIARVPDIRGAEESVTRNLRRGFSADYSMTLSLDEDRVSEGDYFVELYALPRDSNSRTTNTDTTLLEFEIRNCGDEDDEDDSDVPPPPAPEPVPPPVVGEPIDDSGSQGFDDRAYLVVLASLIVIVLVLIILVSVSIAKK